MAKKVLIKILVDHSGSMASCRTEAEKAINGFVDERKTYKDAPQKISLDEFDDEYSAVYDFTDLNIVPKYTLIPKGMTALYDSIARAMKSLEDYKSDKDRERFLIIMTDGYENRSVEHTKESIKKLLEEKQDKGWHVIYLGANQDAVKVAGTMGINPNMSMTYDITRSGSAIKGTSFMMSSGLSSGNYRFTEKQRKEAVGDGSHEPAWISNDYER